MIQTPSKTVELETILDYVSASILVRAALFLTVQGAHSRRLMGIHNTKFTKQNEN